MGYSTDFKGFFSVEPALTPAQIAYLRRFRGSRRMKRDAAIAGKFADPLRTAVGLPIGDDAEFFVGTDAGDEDVFEPGDPRHVTLEIYRRCNPHYSLATCENWVRIFNTHIAYGSWAGQRNDASVLEFDYPPATQPGLWCQWVSSEDGKKIEWDGCEKFYDYVEWIDYLIRRVFTAWGRTVNGRVEYKSGVKSGVIEVVNNVVTKTGVGFQK